MASVVQVSPLVDNPEGQWHTLVDKPEVIMDTLVDKPEVMMSTLVDKPEVIMATLVDKPEGSTAATMAEVVTLANIPDRDSKGRGPSHLSGHPRSTDPYGNTRKNSCARLTSV